MNTSLANIGIHFPKLRKRAIAIGETLGIYRDYPVFKRVYVTVRPDLDQRNGEPERLTSRRRALPICPGPDRMGASQPSSESPPAPLLEPPPGPPGRGSRQAVTMYEWWR